MGNKYANSIHIDLKYVNIYQIPHHGSRHNVTPSVMDMIVAPILPLEEKNGKIAFAAVSMNSDHPKKMVVNAFIRRGCNVYSTIKGNTICHHYGDMPVRTGWSIVDHHSFETKVEDWEV